VKKNLFVITSNEPLFALHGTSYLPLVTINRQGQQITADKAYIYRDKKTDKLSVIDLYGKVNLREPRTLVIADKMHLDLKTKQENLEGIIYRTAVYSSGTAPVFNNAQLQKSRNVYHLTAWGKATEFVQEHPRIYELKNASYSTCPPLTNVWRVQASDIQLNKLTGRGTAKNARLYIKNVPIFYTPYFNFPIDNRRKTGLLFPFAGRTTRSGAQITAPFYWNIEPFLQNAAWKQPIYFAT
jgi:LPS-assembly protein